MTIVGARKPAMDIASADLVFLSSALSTSRLLGCFSSIVEFVRPFTIIHNISAALTSQLSFISRLVTGFYPAQKMPLASPGCTRPPPWDGPGCCCWGTACRPGQCCGRSSACPPPSLSPPPSLQSTRAGSGCGDWFCLKMFNLYENCFWVQFMEYYSSLWTLNWCKERISCLRK